VSRTTWNSPAHRAVMYVEMRAVGANSQRRTPSRAAAGSGVGELLMTVQAAGASTVSWNVALRSGCSKVAYIRRASADSNWE